MGEKSNKIAIIGTGMSGSFMALCLAKKGFSVEMYDKRPDVRKHPYESGRSFNITLYYRSIQAMKKMNVWNDVKKKAIIARGNVAHRENTSKPSIDLFDQTGEEILYTIHRNQLNSVLLNLVEKNKNVKIFFNTELIRIDKRNKKIQLLNTKSKKKFTSFADIIIGADGVNSVVRSKIQNSAKGEVKQIYEDWGYKEVHISLKNAKRLKLLERATHTWPRDNSLLIAFPNPDKSFTLMFNLPLRGKGGFSMLQNEKDIKNFITKSFPDLLEILPEITHSFLHKPTGSLSTVITKPWYYKNFMALIGDSAHGVLPFYGQGVSAAFDDCITLCGLIENYQDNWEKIFSSYQSIRKPNTDILAKLSKENFIELRDKSRSSFYIIKDKFDTLLSRLFPRLWLPPLYVMIAHGSLPYKKAVRLHKRREKIAKWSGVNLVLRLISIPCSKFYHKNRGTFDL